MTSLAEIVAPSLAGPCIDERGTAVSVEGESPVLIVEKDGEVSEQPVPQLKAHRIEALARALFTPYDKSAGLLLYGAIGLVAIFLIETLTAVLVLDNSVVDAFYGSAKTLVTVDPNLDVDDGPGWYKVFISLTMIVALVFAAGFTAGLVNRVVERRLTGLVGRRAVPRRDHVVVVGLGQVGMRLCLLLRGCGVPVVAVEQDKEGRNIGVARELGLPLVIGRGSDHSLMGRLSLHRARAVAAVTGGRPGEHLRGDDGPRDRGGHPRRPAGRRRRRRQRDPLPARPRCGPRRPSHRRHPNRLDGARGRGRERRLPRRRCSPQVPRRPPAGGGAETLAG